MISMGDARYVYKPISEERRQKLRAAHQKRLKIPEGYCRIYGAYAPIKFREEIRRVVDSIRKKHGMKAARNAVYDEIRRLTRYQDEQMPSPRISGAYHVRTTALPITYGGA